MPEPQRPLKVFLSYASQDKPLVRELSRRLVGEGWIETWQDEKSLLPGQDWRIKILDAVDTSDIVIIVLSNNSVNKEGYVQKELRYAQEIALEKPEDTIFLIPLRLDECEVPRGLRFYQWVDYFGDKKDASYKALVSSLKLRYEQKLTAEKEEKLRKEKQEREAAEKAARDRAEKEAEEKRRIAREKTERKDAERKQKEQERRENSQRNTKADLAGKGVWESIKEINPGYWIVAFVILGVVVALYASLNRPSQSPEETPVITATLTVTVEPSETPNPTSIPTSALSPTPLPTEITDAKGVSMVLVPAGEFTMGNLAENALNFCENIKSNIENFGSSCNVTDYQHEEPIHKVYINDYFMDIFEVSNEEYKKCVLAGECLPPSSINANGYSSYYNNDYLVTYPVLNVTWNMAEKYCKWRGARLPTEAEWEKAARGVDERSFPWGSNTSSGYIFQSIFYSNRANINLNPRIYITTVPISSNSKGLSPYGIYNMAGNVAEWVNDWYGNNYYSTSPYENPTGPGLGESKVIRGGSVNDRDARTTARDFMGPTEFNTGVGFRCVKDAP